MDIQQRNGPINGNSVCVYVVYICMCVYTMYVCDPQLSGFNNTYVHVLVSVPHICANYLTCKNVNYLYRISPPLSLKGEVNMYSCSAYSSAVSLIQSAENGGQ